MTQPSPEEQERLSHLFGHLNMCMQCTNEEEATKHIEAQETLARWGAQAAANPIE